MLRMLLSGPIWLSLNSSRVCALALGKSARALSSASVFAGVTPPRMVTNE